MRLSIWSCYNYISESMTYGKDLYGSECCWPADPGTDPGCQHCAWNSWLFSSVDPDMI